MTRHRVEVLAAFVLGAVLAIGVASPTDGGRHNCKPAWKCATPTPATASLAAPTLTPTPRPATAPPSIRPSVSPTPASTAPSCGTSLQARLDAAPAGATLNLLGCSYSSGATIAKPLTLIGGAITTSSKGLVVASSNVTIAGVTITGPQATTYSSAQMGIYALATAAAPIDNLVIRDSRIQRFGHGGIWLRHLTDFSITGNTITDAVYSGIEIISGIRGDVSGNTVQRIGVVGASANSNNAYGIAITRWTTSSSEPASSDVIVASNLVEGVPTWHGLDTHGGIRVTFSGNTVRGSRDGIFVTGWADARATDVVTDGNDVVNTSGSNQYGITSVYSTGGQVTGNTIAGWLAGHAILTTSSGQAAATAVDLTVSGNEVLP